ncbi:MAG TPA: GWxTD domain-containing protein [Candidatus Acidoferrales bacterium]|nr:GWxTD domain-containing protein [Candidatus Acidoferrales bacterium]
MTIFGMMDKSIHKFFLLFPLVAAVFVPIGFVWTQPLTQKENFHVASWVLASSKDSVTVSFGYAIPYNRLIFTRTNYTPEGSAGLERFEADLSFSIDATDSATAVNHHKLSERTVAAKDFATTQDSKRLAENIITMTLPKSVYRVSAEVRDDNQQMTYIAHTETRNLNVTNPLNILSITFADSLDRNAFYPNFTDNTAVFPRPITFAVIMSDTTAQVIHLSLETVLGTDIISDSLSPRKGRLIPVDSDGTFSLRVDADRGHSLYSGKFEIDSLVEGSYCLEANLNGKTDKTYFNYSWVDKPFTLKDPKTAISLLKYIVSDSVFSYLNSGNDKEKKEKFDQYWKSHSPTPKAAYNELEAEFYERADYAFEHFRTVSIDDGTATDRGKAYILFGKPTNVEREFRRDGTYEIWYYPNHGKSLVFKELNPGNFILYQTKNL